MKIYATSVALVMWLATIQLLQGHTERTYRAGE
jgi:hypothetical protein